MESDKQSRLILAENKMLFITVRGSSNETSSLLHFLV
jgi:hypothetical protein